MNDERRPLCPIPCVGHCILESCNFWDEERQECSGLCFGEYEALEETTTPPTDSPCTIHWTEDFD